MERKKRCVIMDFDSTIFKSPDRKDGEVRYFEETGELWPFAGWWGRVETLCPPIVAKKPSFDMLIAETIAAYREDFKDKDTTLILMTGRPFRTAWRVKEILDHYDIKFHDYYFRGMKGQRGSDTLEIKKNIIEDKLIHDGLEILEIWEDRPSHTSAFLDLAKKWKVKHKLSIIVHDVMTQQHHKVG